MMKWMVLAMLFLISVLNYTDKAIYGLAGEQIMSGLNLSYEQFGIPSSTFFFAYAIGSVIIGMLTYRFNTKYLLITIALGWTVSMTGAYLVESFTGLIIIRTILGFFEGGTYGLCVAHVTKWFTSQSRGFVYAIMTSGTTVGTYLASPILVALLMSFGWKHTFAILGLASFIWAIIFLIMRDRPKVPLNEPMKDLPTAQTAQFKDIPKIFSNPFILSIFSIGFVSMWVTTWVVTWAPTYLTQIAGLQPQAMANVMLGIGLSSMAFAIGLGRFSDYLFRKTQSLIKSYDVVLVTVLFIGAAAFALTTIIASPVFSVLLLGLGLVLNACLLPMLTTINSLIIPKNLVGTVSSISLAFYSMAAIIGPALSGFLIENVSDDIRVGFNTGVLLFVGLYTLSALIILLTGKRKASLSNLGTTMNKDPQQAQPVSK